MFNKRGVQPGVSMISVVIEPQLEVFERAAGLQQRCDNVDSQVAVEELERPQILDVTMEGVYGVVVGVIVTFILGVLEIPEVRKALQRLQYRCPWVR